MKTLYRIASFKLCDDRLPAWVLQGLCYAGSMAILVLAAGALTRAGASHAEIVVGLLAASAVAVGFVVLGTLTALMAELRRR
jgi:hypothetical protein